MRTIPWKRLVLGGLLVLLVLALLIQLLPFGRDHSNPAVVREPEWDSPQTQALAVRACFDCHSNETNWEPWYTTVAPVSWLIEHEVEEGRETLNFSNWGAHPRNERTEELVEVIREGEMPPAQYLLLHPEARLTQAEQEQLVNGLVATARR